VQDHAQRGRRAAQLRQIGAHVFEGSKAHQPGHGQRQFRQHFAITGHDETALDLRKTGRCQRHIRIVDADTGDVVVIVADGGGDGACRHAKAPHEARGDVAVLAVPLDHGDAQQVARRIGPLVAIHDRDAFVQVFGDDLALENADDVGILAVGGRPERRLGHGRRLDRVPPHRRDGASRGEGLCVDGAAPGPNGLRPAGGKAVDGHDIGAFARRDQTAILEAERLCRRQRCSPVDRQRR
jgi:hypothetical protein